MDNWSYSNNKMNLYTIGTNKKNAEDFFAILTNNKIEKLLDIRINNKSQLLGFSKGQDLKYFCERCHNIKYEHIPLFAPTKELLKRYQKDHDWPSYKNDFIRILTSRPIAQIFQKIAENSSNICLLCSESQSDKCHRKLVAEYISGLLKNIKISHL